MSADDPLTRVRRTLDEPPEPRLPGQLTLDDPDPDDDPEVT